MQTSKINYLVLWLNIFVISSGIKQLANNPEAKLTIPDVVVLYGYPVEVHEVITPDGYILEVHRIPHSNQSQVNEQPAHRVPVLLVHGILASSADWILAGANKGLGFLLVDLGYDVWLANVRGNRYSKQHVTLNSKEKIYWDFSWHEIGKFDLPSMIDYVLDHSKQEKLFYVGHSQGTTSFYVMCSELPEYNQKVRAMFALAPIAFMTHVTGPLIKLVLKSAEWIRQIGVTEFLPNNDFMTEISQSLCHEHAKTQPLCSNVLFMLCGFNEKNLNASLLTTILGHFPAGASVGQFFHYAQEVKSGRFCKYDYGREKNLQIYKSEEPPDYRLDHVRVPVALFCSYNDWLADEKDVRRLQKQLPNVTGFYMNADKNFNHLDYLWGLNAKQTVYDTLIALMKTF